IPELLGSLEARNDFVIYLLMAFVLCLCCSNSLEKLAKFKVSYKLAILIGFYLLISLMTLAVTPYTEFIYFNF
ncbi:MAG: MBOAT family protein, partial [Helicobacter sp.]|nr:MBOAT family protein [Helicobacter sp.]